MCLPAAPLMIGLAIATTAVSVVSQIQSAKAETKAINKANDTRQDEIDKNTSGEINDRLREMRREQGRVTVAAGESGLNLASGSVEALLMDSAMQAELSNDRSYANRESRKKASAAEANAMIPSRPTALGAGLQIGLAGANAYAGQKAAKMRSERSDG